MQKDFDKITLINVPEPIRSRMVKERINVWQGDIKDNGAQPRVAEPGELLCFDCRLADGQIARPVMALVLCEWMGGNLVLPLLPQRDAVLSRQWLLSDLAPGCLYPYDVVLDTSLAMTLTPEALGQGKQVGRLPEDWCRWLMNYYINAEDEDQPEALVAARGTVSDLEHLTDGLLDWYTGEYRELWSLFVRKFCALDAPYLKLDEDEEDDEEVELSCEHGLDDPSRASDEPPRCYHRADLWESGQCSVARCGGCSFEGTECDRCTRP